jgi:PAS domain S-box-containing protein
VRTLIVEASQREVVRLALQATHANFRALVDTINGIVWEADPQTLDILFVSRSAERLLGYPVSVWSTRGFWINHIYHEDRDRILAELTRAIQEGNGNYTLDYRMLDLRRRVVWVRDTITIFSEGGKTRMLGVAVNITDRKELEQRLHETHALLEERVAERTKELSVTIADLEAFSYSISHDLRAPLRAMEGYAQILQQRLKDKIEPIDRDFLGRITSGAERLDALVQDVLKYSRVARTAIELEPVNVQDLVEGIVRDYPNLQPPKANIEIHKPMAPVKANAAFLTQCISNLLANAVKFVRPGQHPQVRVWTQEMRDNVRLWFQDNGIGIAPENQHRIFGIFQRMHSPKEYEGTGIGLAIVKKAAERMGGKVGLESAVGQGSKFWLELPRP